MKYTLRGGSTISSEWILANVTLRISQFFLRSVAEVLGHALLWAVFDDEISPEQDTRLVQRVKTGCAQVEGLSEGVNPVVKVPLVVANAEGVVVISELVGEDGKDGED